MSGSLTGLITHTRRVQTLYKKALRSLEDHVHRRDVYRYQAVLMRKRFDDNKDIQDMRVAKELLKQGEEELFQNQHWQPRKFPNSPGGVAFGREVPVSDWVIDHWDPLEKAQYPEYFARREQRKVEFVKLWQAKYGKHTDSGHH